jgi:hypothetical protein
LVCGFGSGFVASALLVVACAHPPQPLPTPPPRIQSSPPEQRAALDEAVGKDLPVEEQRWGIGEAKELKKEKREFAEEAQQRNAAMALVRMPPPNDSGVFGPDGGVRDGGGDGKQMR